ncbi:MAG: FG-GAP-like repeat-containing protein [Propionicimonas sp.]
MRFPLMVVAATAAIALAVPGRCRQWRARSPRRRPRGSRGGTDFDGDGTVDLAVSVIPDEQMTALRVHYGSGATVTVSAPELTGEAEGQLRRGLVAHDLDADGYTDLAVGAAFGTTQLVYLLFGSASGLDFSAPVAVPAPTQVDDKGVFGESLAVLDAPVRRLAVGIGYGYGDFTGGVAVYDLDADGVPSGAPTLVTPSSVGIGDSSSYFGQSVAATGSLLFVGRPSPTSARSSTPGRSPCSPWARTVSAAAGSCPRRRWASPAYPRAGTRSATASPRARATSRWEPPVMRSDRHAPPARSPSSGSAGPRSPRAPASPSPPPGSPGIAEKHDRFGHAVALGTVCTGVTGVVVGGPGEAIRTSVLAGAAWVVPLSPSRTCTPASCPRATACPAGPPTACSSARRSASPGTPGPVGTPW